MLYGVTAHQSQDIEKHDRAKDKLSRLVPVIYQFTLDLVLGKVPDCHLGRG
jgi:hypothetical protein